MARQRSHLDIFIETALTGDAHRLDGQHRNARLIAATIQECFEAGYRDASVGRIAKTARVSTSSLYQLFGTRENLLETAALFAAQTISAELAELVEETEPRARLIELLVHHCAIFSHPHASWLYRAHVSGDISQHAVLLEHGKLMRLEFEAFWLAELTALQTRELIRIPCMSEAINFLLGAVQRRTLLAMLLFGTDDLAEPDPYVAATSAVDWLFVQFGAPQLHQMTAHGR